MIVEFHSVAEIIYSGMVVLNLYYCTVQSLNICQLIPHGIVFTVVFQYVIARIKADIRATLFREDMGDLCIYVMEGISCIYLVPSA